MVYWKLTVTGRLTNVRAQDFTRADEAWQAYEACIRDLERDEFIRRGEEFIVYGRASTQELFRPRDQALASVHLQSHDGRPPSVDTA